MRRRYLVACDVSDPKRLRRTFRVLHGFGNAVQYSVFVCDLSGVERQLLRAKLTELLNLNEDRALIVDLGESTFEELAFEVVGRLVGAMPKDFRATLI